MKCEWKTYQVGDLCTSVSETYKGKDEYVVLINTSDVLEGKILNHTLTKNANLKGQFKKKFQTKDILYSEIRPANKRFAFVDIEDTQNYIASTKLMVIRANADIIMPEYLFIYLQMPTVIAELQMLAETRSGTFPQITFSSEIVPLNISIPDKESQNRIVKIFRSLDDKIELNNKINENLEKTTQLLFLKYFGHISYDNLTDGWRVAKLDDVAVICKNSFNPVKEPKTLLEHYSIPAFDEAHFPVFELSSNIKSNKFKIDADCFMISKLNPTTKRVWKPYCLSGHAVCSTEFIVYKAKNRRYTDFLYSLINSDAFSAFMCSHVTGSTGSRQRTTPSDTLQYTFAMPPQADIDAFTALVHPMYEQIRIKAIENDRLKKLRNSILPKLMSGEIDVTSINL